jgi:hypothetical protein
MTYLVKRDSTGKIANEYRAVAYITKRCIKGYCVIENGHAAKISDLEKEGYVRISGKASVNEVRAWCERLRGSF